MGKGGKEGQGTADITLRAEGKVGASETCRSSKSVGSWKGKRKNIIVE